MKTDRKLRQKEEGMHFQSFEVDLLVDRQWRQEARDDSILLLNFLV